jgi:hypothetical protein
MSHFEWLDVNQSITKPFQNIVFAGLDQNRGCLPEKLENATGKE